MRRLPIRRPATTLFPQADQLWKLRQMLEKGGEFSLAEAGQQLGLSPRWTGYYAVAAEALGLAKRRDGRLLLVQQGKRLLQTSERSASEAKVWRAAIEASTAVRRVAPYLFTKPLALAELTERIARCGLAPSTAKRRAETLLRWRDSVLNAQDTLTLPLHAAPRMGYGEIAMLKDLRIQSFKAFGASKGHAKDAAAAFSMSPLTVLAGPNGAGKSTVLQAIDVLGLLVRGNVSEMLAAHEWGYADLPHLRSATQTIAIEVELEVGTSVLRWQLVLGARRHPGIAAENVSVRRQDSGRWQSLLERTGRRVKITRESDGESASPPPLTLPQSWLSTLDPKEDAEAYPGLLAVKAWAESIHAFWSLTPSALRAPSSGTSDRIGAHGENLASFLFRLKRNNEDAFSRFVERVRRHYARLVQITPRSDATGMRYLEITERWNGEQATFNARQVSDGLLRLMVIASIPEWPSRPSVVLLDEIENGLHPRLIGGVAGLLTEVAETSQVVTTTHSPITLNYVPAESVRLVTRGKAGTVVVTKLTETRGYASLREHFEPGELWYNVGEERLIPAASKR